MICEEILGSINYRLENDVKTHLYLVAVNSNFLIYCDDSILSLAIVFETPLCNFNFNLWLNMYFF